MQKDIIQPHPFFFSFTNELLIVLKSDFVLFNFLSPIAISQTSTKNCIRLSFMILRLFLERIKRSRLLDTLNQCARAILRSFMKTTSWADRSKPNERWCRFFGIFCGISITFFRKIARKIKKIFHFLHYGYVFEQS